MNNDNRLIKIIRFQKKKIDSNIYESFNIILKRMQLLQREEDVKWRQKEKDIEKKERKLNEEDDEDE
ncbi:MAG: hypothetical protein QXU98_05520 [Candidatus Parvarchaeota archaeon]